MRCIFCCCCSAAWCDPNETNSLRLVIVSAIETTWESEPVTLSWGRTSAPNCFTNDTPHAGCRAGTRTQLFPGEELHLEPGNRSARGGGGVGSREESSSASRGSVGPAEAQAGPGYNFRARQRLGHTPGNKRQLGFGNIGTFCGLET